MNMKTLILSLACALGTYAAAESVQCQFIGQMKVCSNGYTENQIGNYTYGNDGSSRTEIGNTMIYTPPSRVQVAPAQLPQMIQYGTQPQGNAFSGFADGLNGR